MHPDRYLATYLDDHLAGSLVGLEIARRAAGNNRDTPTGRVLAEIAEEILEHRRVLEVKRGVSPRRRLERQRFKAAAELA